VNPVQYLQTQRLLLAKNLLTDTSLSVTDVAMAAGFGSIRRFNELFQKHYRLSPSRFRNNDGTVAGDPDSITLSLAYRPPYAWDRLLSFLAARAILGVEWVEQGVYRRTVALRKGSATYAGWISVQNLPKRNAVSVTAAASLLPVLPQVLARIRHLFDLNCDPSTLFEKLAAMDAIAPDIRVPGIRLPGCFDPFEMAIRAVLGQQITVKAARTVAGRLAASFGEKIETPFPELSRIFPQPDSILSLEPPIEDRFGPLGITGARARSILALAQAMANGTITLSPGANPPMEMAKLLELPGFGRWTAQYIAMRALGWPDAFLETDYGVKKALSAIPVNERAALVHEWSPWGSYATVTLWESLKQVKNIVKEKGHDDVHCAD
jgi:AraC family transcriptional regulator of adaptative response / DNA-3-methyladenine glycosylase II